MFKKIAFKSLNLCQNSLQSFDTFWAQPEIDAWYHDLSLFRIPYYKQTYKRNATLPLYIAASEWRLLDLGTIYSMFGLVISRFRPTWVESSKRLLPTLVSVNRASHVSKHADNHSSSSLRSTLKSRRRWECLSCSTSVFRDSSQAEGAEESTPPWRNSST